MEGRGGSCAGTGDLMCMADCLCSHACIKTLKHQPCSRHDPSRRQASKHARRPLRPSAACCRQAQPASESGPAPLQRAFCLLSSGTWVGGNTRVAAMPAMSSKERIGSNLVCLGDGSLRVTRCMQRIHCVRVTVILPRCCHDGVEGGPTHAVSQYL